VKEVPGYAASRVGVALEHLDEAMRYAHRGRRVFFHERDPDTRRLVEAELRKSFETLNRLGDSFWNANPTLPREKIAAIRQLLTHDYSEAAPDELWRIVSQDVPALRRRLARAKIP
jgi:uncharacterized protein with HEPN domain